MLIQMAGVFLFWWLLILGIGAVSIFALDRFVLKPRKEKARVAGPLANFLVQPKAAVVPVEQPEPAMAAASSGGESPGQRRPAFETPLPGPRRYFIGKGPAEDEKA